MGRPEVVRRWFIGVAVAAGVDVSIPKSTGSGCGDVIAAVGAAREAIGLPFGEGSVIGAVTAARLGWLSQVVVGGSCHRGGRYHWRRVVQHQLSLTFWPQMGHRRGDDCLATGLGGIAETGVGVISTEDEKRRERGHAVGLFRYQLICPALDKDLSTKARGRLVREIAAREHVDPFGTSVRYSRDTLDRWIRRYRAGGFAELIPSTRMSTPRTDGATLELAAALKRENPARTAAQVARILRTSTGWAPSESTLLRLFHRCESPGPKVCRDCGRVGRFGANSAWVLCAAIAHNLLRAAGVLAGERHSRARASTLRRRIVTIPARLARPQHRPVLHLPTHWPWSPHWLALWHNTIGYRPPTPMTA